jgi:adenylate cyclase
VQPESTPDVPSTIIMPAPSAIAHGGMAWLEGPQGERRYVQSELRIGRGELNDLRLSDASVSRFHAFLRRIDGRYLLSDLGSQNGTSVNGEQVHAPSPLKSGDRIQVGTTELVFHLDAPTETLTVTDDQTAGLASSTQSHEYVQGDLRIVSVLFLDLQGFTAMSENMAPDEVTQIMNRCFERLTTTVARFGGYVDKYVGDAMMVLFGAPVAHADDPERSVRAALALHEELQRFNRRVLSRAHIDLQMRIGINTGEVLAGRVGGSQFGQYTVMGDPVNLASRLEHACRVGNVLVGETTYRFTRHAVRYAALPPMSIRGKAEPVQAYEVVGLQSQPTSVGSALESSFVGRERELELLGGLINSSPRGFQSATVTGSSSAGKSSLLNELHRRYAMAARWAVARCSEYDQQTPLGALRQLAQQILPLSDGSREVTSASQSEAHGAQLAALAPLLSPNLEPTLTALPEAGRRALVSAFTQLVAVHAVRDCLVLAIDGAQWMDGESLAVLDAVLPDLEDARVVLITTAWPEWDHQWPHEVHRLALERLSPQECAQLVSFLLRSDAVARDTLEVLTRECGGNPLLLREIVRGGVETGGLSESDGQWRLVRGEAGVTGASVDSLRTIVQARLDQLSLEERRVLQVAAVLGQSWTGSLLAQVVVENLPVPDLLRRLAEREYLVPEMGDVEPGYRFAYSITQEVAYASLPHGERERLHERAGRLLQLDFDPGRPDKAALRQLIYHFMRSSNHEHAAQYLLYAANAVAGYADDAWAILTYRRALEQAHKTADRPRRRSLALEIQEGLGDALLRQSNFADAQVAFEAASELDDSLERADWLRAKLALVASRQGNHRRVLGLARAVLEGSRDPIVTRLVEARAALSLCSLGQLREADERAARALAVGETEPQDQERFDLALAAAGAIRRLQGDLADARAILERAATLRTPTMPGEAADDLRIELGLTCHSLGDTVAAVQAVEQVLRLRAPFGPSEAPELSALDDTLAMRHGASGDPRDSWVFANAEILLGRVLVERANFERGREHLADALVRAQRIGAREVALAARMHLADAALADGHAAEAADQARGVAASADALKLRPLVCDAQVVLAMALIQLGSFGEAVEVARGSVVHARTQHLPLHEAVGRRALGLALVHQGDAAQGRKHLEDAASELERMGARVELARTMRTIADLES